MPPELGEVSPHLPPQELEVGSDHSAPPELDEHSAHSTAPENDEVSVQPAPPEHTPIDIAQNAPIQLLPALMVPPNFNDDDRLGEGTYGFVDVITVGGVMLARKTFLGRSFDTEVATYQRLQANNGFCQFLIRMLVSFLTIYLLFTKHFLKH